MSFAPSPQQAAATAAIVEWHRHLRAQQQVFRLFGYAGAGKAAGPAGLAGGARPARAHLGLRHRPPQGAGLAVHDDGLGRAAEDRARRLHTAITRAERGPVVVD